VTAAPSLAPSDPPTAVTAVDDLCAGRSCGGNGVCQADTGDCVCDVGCGPNCEWGIGSGVDCPEDVDDDDDDEGTRKRPTLRPFHYKAREP